MSISSRIQEIETHIGDVYDTINYSYDTTGVNKNIINIPKYLKKGYIDIINNGIDTLYNNFPKVSGIGSNLSLTPTYEAPIKLNKIQGDTLQDGTPTPDTPVEIQSVTGLQNINVCGKNLFDMSTAVQSSYGYHNNTGTLTHIDNNTIKIVKGNTSTDARMSVANNINISSGTTISVSWEYGTGNGNVVGQIQAVNNSGSVINLTSLNNNGLSSPQILTLTDDIKYIYLGTAWNNHSDLVIKNIQIEVGSATEYEPYKGNTYEVNLGKNLLPFTNQDFTLKDMHYYIQNGNIYLNGTNAGETGSNNALFKENFSFYLEAGTYTLQDKGLVSGNRDIRKYSDNTVLGRLNPNSKVVSFTLTERTQVYLGFYIYNQTYNNELIEVQLEKGSKATPYSPYFTPIELNEIGDYQDSIKKSTGKNLCTGVRKSSSNNDLFFDFSNNISQTITLSATINSQTQGNSIYLSVDGVSKGKVGEMTGTANTKQTTTITFTNEMYEAIQNSTTCFLQLYRNNAGFVIPNDGQINNGSTALPYEPYGKVWYVEKNTRKLELAIANMDNSDNYPGWKNQTQLYQDIYNGTSQSILLNYTSFYTNITSYNYDGIRCNFTVSTNPVLYLRKDNFNLTQTEWQTNYPNLVFKMVYCLQNPTYTEITNTELINQLEALNTAKSQEGTTNISITSEDLEMILNVSALKGDIE